MNAYIESGILELYVFGDLPEAERMQVEEMMAKHAEIRREVADIERVLEATAGAYAIEPDEKLEAKTLDLLFPVTEEKTTAESFEAAEPRVVQMDRPSPFYKYAFAASVALLAVSGAVIFSLSSKLKNTNEQLIAIQQQNQKFANQVNYMDKQLESTSSMLDIYRNPDFQRVKLAGTKLSPQSEMIVAWNPKAKKVAIDRAALKLPKNDAQHQYQLWALVDGKPVDLGVFDAGTDNSGMQDMKTIAIAQAFAVTREPRGGSVSPTLDQMVVMGAL
ncbi:MAG: anti-sigma factor [Mucilaginibacter polytrichastri]|nr:anti-sigma factor [Mucilaginibacter polytrichastri]